jgi:hypothetical protein
VTGSNGEPQANSARPSDQRYACVAVHSAFDVGLDSANTIGRLLSDAIRAHDILGECAADRRDADDRVGRSAFTCVEQRAYGARSCA